MQGRIGKKGWLLLVDANAANVCFNLTQRANM